jgi:Fe-Mn family superoxide dismutase
MKEFAAKPLEIKDGANGLSQKQLEEHYKLYEGYVKKSNEIRKKIPEADKAEATATFSLIGDLKRQESFAMNGMRLHEIYFGLMGGDGKPEGKVAEMIIRDYGSIENWKADMIAAGISARGWVITAYDPMNDEIRNYSADAHNIGIIAGTVPLIALDVYEHAYFIDYGTNRKSYIEAYLNAIDWKKTDIGMMM